MVDNLILGVPMRFLHFRLALCILLLRFADARDQPPKPEVQPPATAFVHVNVTPMSHEQVLEDQTVIVEALGLPGSGPLEALRCRLAHGESRDAVST